MGTSASIIACSRRLLSDIHRQCPVQRDRRDAALTSHITAKDAYGNTVTGFGGSVSLTSSDAQTVHISRDAGVQQRHGDCDGHAQHARYGHAHGGLGNDQWHQRQHHRRRRLPCG